MSPAAGEVSAFRRSAEAAGEALRSGMAEARSGVMSPESAAVLRDAVEGYEALRRDGERIAAGLGCAEFSAWVDEMREVGAGPRAMVASMRPITAS